MKWNTFDIDPNSYLAKQMRKNAYCPCPSPSACITHTQTERKIDRDTQEYPATNTDKHATYIDYQLVSALAY